MTTLYEIAQQRAEAERRFWEAHGAGALAAMQRAAFSRRANAILR